MGVLVGVPARASIPSRWRAGLCPPARALARTHAHPRRVPRLGGSPRGPSGRHARAARRCGGRTPGLEGSLCELLCRHGPQGRAGRRPPPGRQRLGVRAMTGTHPHTEAHFVISVLTSTSPLVNPFDLHAFASANHVRVTEAVGFKKQVRLFPRLHPLPLVAARRPRVERASRMLVGGPVCVGAWMCLDHPIFHRPEQHQLAPPQPYHPNGGRIGAHV